MNNNISLYRRKAIESFTTKLNLFVFYSVLNNLEKFELNDFVEFEITKDLVLKYTSEYWQKFKHEDIEGFSVTIEEIWKKTEYTKSSQSVLFKEFERDYINNTFPKKFPLNKFENLVYKKENHCHYCKITTEDIEKLADNKKIFKKNFRGWSLEIDRKDSNMEYTPENCVMACYWCNNAKTDEFTYEEFISVGRTIQGIWENRKK
jgi:5-methylcytosine-specific restriction endonuclease McrA